MTAEPLVALPLEVLRQRSSSKWRRYPADVLPLFVAETDFSLAPPIRAALERAVALGDTGYASRDPELPRAFAGFAARRYGWAVDPGGIRPTGDVMMGVVELLRALLQPGERVVVTPPVYPPFFAGVPEAGGVAERVPLVDTGEGWELDLDRIDAALAAGARAVLLCNPHNPTGTVHRREALAALAESAARHGAWVVSDEIHAPLTATGSGFTPFLAASGTAAEVGVAVTSASKAFNLAGLKCALMIAASDRGRAALDGMPDEVAWRTGLLGELAAIAAFSSESDAWLDGLVVAIDRNKRLLADLLAERVPLARYRVPDAGFLAWVDLSAYGWGPNPAEHLVREARVALHHGPLFGEQGDGHVRINVGCDPELLTEAVDRIAALAAR